MFRRVLLGLILCLATTTCWSQEITFTLTLPADKAQKVVDSWIASHDAQQGVQALKGSSPEMQKAWISDRLYDVLFQPYVLQEIRTAAAQRETDLKLQLRGKPADKPEHQVEQLTTPPVVAEAPADPTPPAEAGAPPLGEKLEVTGIAMHWDAAKKCYIEDKSEERVRVQSWRDEQGGLHPMSLIRTLNARKKDPRSQDTKVVN